MEWKLKRIYHMFDLWFEFVDEKGNEISVDCGYDCVEIHLYDRKEEKTITFYCPFSLVSEVFEKGFELKEFLRYVQAFKKKTQLELVEKIFEGKITLDKLKKLANSVKKRKVLEESFEKIPEITLVKNGILYKRYSEPIVIFENFGKVEMFLTTKKRFVEFFKKDKIVPKIKDKLYRIGSKDKFDTALELYDKVLSYRYLDSTFVISNREKVLNMLAKMIVDNFIDRNFLIHELVCIVDSFTRTNVELPKEFIEKYSNAVNKYVESLENCDKIHPLDKLYIEILSRVFESPRALFLQVKLC